MFLHFLFCFNQKLENNFLRDETEGKSFFTLKAYKCVDVTRIIYNYYQFHYYFKFLLYMTMTFINRIFISWLSSILYHQQIFRVISCFYQYINCVKLFFGK